MSSKNVLTYCQKCQRMKRQFGACLRAQHPLVQSTTVYAEDVQQAFLRFAEELSFDKLLIKKYKLGNDLNKLVFVLRYVEDISPAEAEEGETKTFNPSLCPCHEKPILGYCYDCGRGICFTNSVHFGHNYIIFSETPLRVIRPDFTYDDINGFLEVRKAIDSVKLTFDLQTERSKKLYYQIFQDLAKWLSKKTSDIVKEGIIEVFQMLSTNPIQEGIEADAHGLETGELTLKENYKTSWQSDDLKQSLCPSIVEHFDKKQTLLRKATYHSYTCRFFDDLVYEMEVPYLKTIKTKLMNNWFYTTSEYSKVVPWRHDILDGNYRHIDLFLYVGDPVEVNVFNSRRDWNVNPVEITHSERLLATTHANWIPNGKNKYFYFISTLGELVRLRVCAHGETPQKVKVVGFDGSEISSFESTGEDVIKLPGEAKPKRLLTLSNTLLEAIVITETGEMLCLSKTGVEETIVLRWKPMKPGLYSSDSKLRCYIGSWLYPDEEPEKGLFASKKAIYIYNRPVIKGRFDFVRSFNESRFQVFYSRRSYLGSMSIVF